MKGEICHLCSENDHSSFISSETSTVTVETVTQSNSGPPETKPSAASDCDYPVLDHGSEQKVPCSTMESNGGPPVAKASPEFLWY